MSAILLIVHGIARFGTGYFPCDLGCNPDSPLVSQQLHNLFGLIMFLSLVLASSLWAYLALFPYKQRAFGVFSLVCTLLALAVLPAMTAALETGQNFGIYQRINYGASVTWVAGFAWFLLARVNSRG